MPDTLAFSDLDREQLDEWAADICELFMSSVRNDTGNERLWIKNIKEFIDRKLESDNQEFKRHHVYDVVVHIFAKHGRFVPEAAKQYTDSLAAIYRIPRDRIRVVEAGTINPIRYLGEYAAKWVAELIRDLPETDPVCVGFSSGRTTRAVATSLSKCVRFDRPFPSMRIHSINSGFNAIDPSTAAVCFIGFFNDAAIPVTSIGLFSSPLVPVGGSRRVNCIEP